MLAVPPPDVSLSVSDGALIAGGVGVVSLNCSAMVDMDVVNEGNILFTFTWRDRDSSEVADDGRFSISNAGPSSSSISSLQLSPLSTADTNFICTVTATEKNSRLLPSQPATAEITVNVTSETCITYIVHVTVCTYTIITKCQTC